MFVTGALLLGLAGLAQSKVQHLGPPDSVQVHYPNGTVAEYSNITVGLDPPAFAANYSGFHYLANITVGYPDGSLHDLGDFEVAGCHNETIHNETFEAAGRGFWNVNLNATDEGNYTVFWNVTYGYPPGSQHETEGDVQNATNCDLSTLVYESWEFNTTVLVEKDPEANETATAAVDHFSLTPDPTGIVLEGDDTSGASRTVAGLAVVGLVSLATVFTMI